MVPRIFERLAAPVRRRRVTLAVRVIPYSENPLSPIVPYAPASAENAQTRDSVEHMVPPLSSHSSIDTVIARP
jgi:hypothetical protein